MNSDFFSARHASKSPLFPWEAFLVLSGIFLIALRHIPLLVEPRIWAEEGNVFLADALQRPLLTAFLSPHLGYYSLFNNLVAAFSVHFVPLRYAAHLSTYSAALVQIATSLVIYRSRGMLVPPGIWGFSVALSPYLFSPPEIWLTTTNSHFWFGAGALFIVFSSRIDVFAGLYLLFAFFTGLPSLIFFPFLLLRLFWGFCSGSLNSRVLIIALGFLSLVAQSWALIYYFLGGNENSRLLYRNIPNALGGLKEILIPFSIRYGLGIFYMLTLLVSAGYLMYVLRSSREKWDFVMALLAMLFYSLIAVAGSIAMSGGTRYGLPVYCGAFAVLVMALRQMGQAPPSPFKLVAAICISIIVSAKITDFMGFASQGYPRVYYSSSWPSWYQQIAARSDCAPLNAAIFPQWPDSKWYVSIPKGKGKPCP